MTTIKEPLELWFEKWNRKLVTGRCVHELKEIVNNSFKQGQLSQMEEIKSMIDKARDNGNIYNGGFSPALLLSDLLKYLDKKSRR